MYDMGCRTECIQVSIMVVLVYSRVPTTTFLQAFLVHSLLTFQACLCAKLYICTYIYINDIHPLVFYMHKALDIVIPGMQIPIYTYILLCKRNFTSPHRIKSPQDCITKEYTIFLKLNFPKKILFLFLFLLEFFILHTFFMF